MRSFQFSDAKSHKFWQIDVTGSSFTVTYGKVGTAGQTQTKDFDSPEKAQAAADKLIKEKTGKGYKETTPTAATAADSDATALERGILDHRDEFVRWAVYSDYLTERGDPRGEFMRVQLDLEDESLSVADRKKLKKREADILAEHERAWLGPLAAFTIDTEAGEVWVDEERVTRRPVMHRFERGWLAVLDIESLSVNLVRAIGACAGARLLRELVVHRTAVEAPEGRGDRHADGRYAPGPDVPADIDSYDDPSLHALTRCPYLAAVRAFILGEGEQASCHLSGELAFHLVKQMPHIEDLRLYAHRVDAKKLFALPMPQLKSLVLFHSNKYPLEKLAANKTVTNLTTIRCHPHAIDFDDDDEPGAYIRLKQLKAICRAPHLDKLTHLCLRLTDFGDDGAKEIVSSGILKRLKVLDLQGGCMSDEGAEVLAKCPDLKNLELLNLNSNALTATGIAALQATKVKVTTESQHNNAGGEFGDGELPEYLFEGDIE